MKRTQTGSGREPVEIRLLSMMSLQKPDPVCNSFVIIHADNLSSPRQSAHPLLAPILTHADDLRQFAHERFARFPVVLITPDNELEHLCTDVAPPLQGGSQPAAGRPILGFSGSDAFVR